MENRVENRFYNCKDIMAIVGCSQSHALGLIRNWNKELEARGYTVPIAGKVIKKYAELKLGFEIKSLEDVCNA